MTDRELLEREIELLWGTDDLGRHEAPPMAAVATPSADPVAADDVPAELLERAPGGPVVRSCLSYLLQIPAVSPEARPGTRLVTSTARGPGRLGELRPQAWWTASEWDDLLTGRLGPWAVLADDDRVLALCHTPRLRRRAAEAGVWTHPDHRRRGFATLVTRAWAQTCADEADVLFYSLLADNQASRAVVVRLEAQLGARPLGRVWQLWDQGTSETSIE